LREGGSDDGWANGTDSMMVSSVGFGTSGFEASCGIWRLKLVLIKIIY
jgi:hypothetical protein